LGKALLELAGVADYLVIDRGAEGVDCVEHQFEEAQWLETFKPLPGAVIFNR
jgi:hypothetical protein